MRSFGIAILAMLVSAMFASAFGLEASDTMQVWRHASTKDRSDLLDRLLGKRPGEKSGVLNCVEEASKISGHAELQIGEVVKACEAQGVGQPV